MSLGFPPSKRTSIGSLPAGLEHVSGPLGRVMADLEIKMAARALVERDCRYDGANIIIPCADHSEAMRLVRELRSALERAA